MTNMGKAIAREVTRAIVVTITTRACPNCGKRGKVVRLSFGSMVLGHSCRACKWERAA